MFEIYTCMHNGDLHCWVKTYFDPNEEREPRLSLSKDFILPMFMEGQSGQKGHFLILINHLLILINHLLILINHLLILENAEKHTACDSISS